MYSVLLGKTCGNGRIVMYREALSTIKVLLAINILSILVVFYIGFQLDSIALIAFATDKTLDSVSNLVSFIGIYYASQKPDYDHLYGHTKFEVLARFILSIILFLSVFQIIINAIKRIIYGPPSILIQITEIAVLSIINIVILLEGLYARHMGKKTGVKTLSLESYNYFNDTVSLLVITSGLILSRYNLSIIDPILAIFFAGLIIKLGWEIFKESVDILTDKAIIPPNEIKNIALSVEGALDCYDITTRTDGVGIFLECTVAVDPNLNVEQAHKVTEKLEEKIKEKYKNYLFKKITIHIEPAKIKDNC